MNKDLRTQREDDKENYSNRGLLEGMVDLPLLQRMPQRFCVREGSDILCKCRTALANEGIIMLLIIGGPGGHAGVSAAPFPVGFDLQRSETKLKTLSPLPA